MYLNGHLSILRQDSDKFFGVDPKKSTRFDRNFSITDFLKINVGTKLALPLVSYCYLKLLILLHLEALHNIDRSKPRRAHCVVSHVVN